MTSVPLPSCQNGSAGEFLVTLQVYGLPDLEKAKFWNWEYLYSFQILSRICFRNILSSILLV